MRGRSRSGPTIRDMVKSDVADIKNTAGRAGGAITAGAFLGAFTNGYRWAHLDIAGTGWNEKPGPIMGLGGTGAGVRILAEFLTKWKKPAGQGPKPGPRTSLRVVSAKQRRCGEAGGASAARRAKGIAQKARISARGAIRAEREAAPQAISRGAHVRSLRGAAKAAPRLLLTLGPL